MILLLKTYQKWFLCYHLPCTFKIFINVFASQTLYVKANSKKICEEMSFPSFFRKMLIAFLLNHQGLLLDSNSPWKDLLFPRGPNLAQKPLYLAGTVLKIYIQV